MWQNDHAIRMAVAKGVGTAVAYLATLVTLMYPVAKAAGYLG